MNISESIFDHLKSEVDTVFYLPGGGCGQLVDALGKSGLNAVCTLHEQGAGYAAVAYAQYKGFGVCLTTSGPGATNAITPCLAAWMDSVPVMFISGQVMTKWIKTKSMRSRGTQEADIISMVKPITKVAFELGYNFNVSFWMDYMVKMAKSGRPGPVWLSIPQDTQGVEL